MRIPTERLDAADAVVSDGGHPTIPARAKLLPQPPLHHQQHPGGAQHLGVPPAAAEDIEPGDLVACPDPHGYPAMIFEVLEILGLWSEKFQLPEDVDDPCPDWISLAAIPARDHMTLSRFAAERGLEIAEMNHRHAQNSQRERVRRAAEEFVEIVAKLQRAAPEPAAEALRGLRTDDGRTALLDDHGRTALLKALNTVEREDAEEEAPVAA